ncbi:MAG: hypothetical protein HC812_14010 [Leptolyngbya sp. RL_3_1]|nr:hypothetical protein [Leptolyngbya sp. RL_3_1]
MLPSRGSVNTCQLGPFEIGNLLYTLFVAGWFIFFSIPLGLLGVGVGLLILVIQLVISNNRQNQDRS